MLDLLRICIKLGTSTAFCSIFQFKSPFLATVAQVPQFDESGDVTVSKFTDSIDAFLAILWLFCSRIGAALGPTRKIWELRPVAKLLEILHTFFFSP